MTTTARPALLVMNVPSVMLLLPPVMTTASPVVFWMLPPPQLMKPAVLFSTMPFTVLFADRLLKLKPL